MSTRIKKELDQDTIDLVDSALAIPLQYLADFLKAYEIAKPRSKAELRTRLLNALGNGRVKSSDLQELLDKLLVSGRQHVFIFKGPQTTPAAFDTPTRFKRHLSTNQLDHLWSAPIPLKLPADKILISAHHTDSRYVTIVAGQQREYFERVSSKDEWEDENGLTIQYRAFARYVARSLYVFRWDTRSTDVSVHIPQLPGKIDYNKERNSFFELIRPIIGNESFSIIDISKAIKHLHTLEEKKQPETRSTRRAYATGSGRTLTARSASSRDSVQGDRLIDKAMGNLRTSGLGHRNDCYWLIKDQSFYKQCLLDREIHTDLIGQDRRINFGSFSKSEDIYYVLARIRRFAK